MTGLELLEGLSFVDPRFIAEAENARLGRTAPWRALLSVAACLCILLVGAFAYVQMVPMASKSADSFEGAPEAAPEAAPEEMPDSAESAESAESVMETAPEIALITEDQPQSVASVVLRVTALNDAGFQATAEAVSADTNLLITGMQVQVVFDPEGYGSGQTETEREVHPDTLLAAEDARYDPDTNTLYVASVSPAE